MFDMSWGEVMLIGGVALIVIGPKDLPKALRTVGQITTKMRRMAGEFQSQFNEAVREAEFDEIRREVDGVRKSAGTMGPVFNPVQTIRDEIKGAVDGHTKTTPSPTQPLANVAAQLAETDPVPPPGPVPSGYEAAARDLARRETPAEPLASPPPAETPDLPVPAQISAPAKTQPDSAP
ncbi:preprotein translocase subunit TatA [Methylobacterium sp. Leaf99]|uniref:Sec-independent protein translocase protein TatB n=1 Tax=Methylobacterium sp. Leaf99 TaxID=1736251 RepID=UPI0006F65682|nr:Sec-independent protein translocase protein TatB [Methylobacterium sp. Leaf99]KQP06013.1 preprotein translocase subunit TatA [Methylobacterium sp. Leaf99]